MNGAIGVSHATYKLSNLYNIYLTPAYALGDSSLGYLKLGYSATQLKLTAGSDTIAPGQVTSYNLNGYILGAGYKQYLTGNIYGFIEGNFNKYQSVSASTTSCNGYCGTMGGNIGLSSYSFLTGIGYKFWLGSGILGPGSIPPRATKNLNGPLLGLFLFVPFSKQW